MVIDADGSIVVGHDGMGIKRFDRSGTVLTTLLASGNVYGIVSDNSYYYHTLYNGNTVYRIPIAGGSPVGIAALAAASGITHRGGVLYAANSASIIKITGIQSGSPIVTAHATLPTSCVYTGLAFGSQTTDELIASCFSSSTLYRVSADGTTVTNMNIQGLNNPWSLIADYASDTALVSNYGLTSLVSVRMH